MDVTLTYINPQGKTAIFRTRRQADGAHPPLLLNYITGVGGPPVEYSNDQRTGNDGGVFGAPWYPARTIQTGCMIYGKTDAERDRQLRSLLGILNPKLGDGTLVYRNHEGTYKTGARCVVLPSFAANSKQADWKPVLIDYTCPYPFLQGMAELSTLVAASSESFVIPFRVPFRLGSQTYKATANNQSSVPVPVRIIITGPSVNPVITNATTGERMMVRREVAAGAKLTITTGPIISVKIRTAQGVESDALNYVDLLDTAWLQLMPGANDLTYSSNDAAKNTRVEVHWGDWYLGVG